MVRSRFVFAFLLFCLTISLGFGQPQAPITWQARRTLVAGTGTTFDPNHIYPHGDTILVGCAYFNPRLFDAGTVTSNFGATWSPLHIFPDTSIQNTAAGGQGVAFRSDGIYCNAMLTVPAGMGLYRTTNSGLTWTPPCTTWIFTPQCQRGDTIYFYYHADTIAYSIDPCHFSSRWALPIPFRGSGRTRISRSEGYVHVVTRTEQNQPGYPAWNVYYTRGTLWNGTWETPRNINPTISGSQFADIDFDEEGNGCLISMVTFQTQSLCNLVINMTHDNGITWSNYRELTRSASVSWLCPMLLNHCGHLWAAVWIDTTHDVGFDAEGSWMAFSANSGKSWYPSQQVCSQFGAAENWMLLHAIDVRPNYIRVYDIRSDSGFYASVITGILRPDSLPPVISQADSVPSAFPNSIITFSVDATDNDSLWLLDLVIKRIGLLDSSFIHFVRDSSSNHYSAQWQSPADTGTFTYYYRAEDMWENVTVTPTDTFWVGAVSVPEHQLLPTTPSLSVYPSPFNSTVTFRYMLAKPGQTRYAIYSSDGRELYRYSLGVQQPGQHTANWNGKNQAGIAVSSGVYFVRFESGEFHSVKKVVLVR